jgi:hypothetical protein
VAEEVLTFEQRHQRLIVEAKAELEAVRSEARQLKIRERDLERMIAAATGEKKLPPRRKPEEGSETK